MLEDHFEAALKRIEVSGDKAKRVERAHTEVRSILEASDRLRKWGVDTRLIGSYSRDTAIYPGKDVDIFCKFPQLDTSVSPQGVYESVRDVLSAEYGGRAEPRPRSIQIQFEDDFYADVVPTVRASSHWAIPARDQGLWTGRDVAEGWVQTDPERLIELTTQRNGLIAVQGRGAYVPLVKLARQTRKAHLQDQPPDGHYLELVVYWEFEDPPTGGTWADLFTDLLRGVATRLGGGTALIDPCMNEVYRPAPSPDELVKAATMFQELADMAAEALTLEECPAAATWRRILGRNSRGACFALPEGCDEEGRRIPPVMANPERGRQEARGFGSNQFS